MLSDLLVNNRQWAAERIREDEGYFRRLAALQRPEYLWIGCSDSRVPANVIAGLQPGEVFVHRNIANLVHPSDLNLLSVLEFAIEALDIRHVIVCGHYGCGGIQAALEDKRHGIVDHWLQPVRDLANVRAAELDKCDGSHARLDRLCELSVKSQVERLVRSPIMQSAWKAGRQIRIHGWIYGLHNGLLTDLECSYPAA
ncbi:carbonic anhydrase [Nitratireductor mangrovi]|uniref:Carbonic anhydrase n=1 Tax=Nitratireductor mangrovi TaxID=2599600 RepID=A0A5B8KXC8_9HYPH|nr:carbonic anhydrase [Nitratireductor mangrovi]QDZ00229.1 carbonic anhydrase [Nitratireductor mangrovi]